MLVIDNNHKKSASKVAAGMYNPIVFKHITKGYNADKYSPYLGSFYKRLENLLNTKVDYPINILRFFKTIEQQNDFFSKTEEEGFSQYLVSESKSEVNNLPIKNEIGFGEVTKTGWVNTIDLLNKYREFLLSEELLLNKKMDFEKLEFNDEKVTYNGLTADKVIFCEGAFMKENPYFKYLPLVPTKGELFTIKAKDLEVDKILNKGFFCLPLGDNLFRVGATFDRKDLTYSPTDEGKQDLRERIESLITCDYEIVNHQAGIRPTVSDRRPLVGVHFKYENLGLFNGLGTKGVLIAPWLANHFADFLEGKSEIAPEYNLQRVKKGR